MKVKKILAALVAATMSLSAMSFTAFAKNENVARIGDTEYATLLGAIQAAETSAEPVTIEILKDSTESMQVSQHYKGEYTIDLKGHTISFEDGSYLDLGGTKTLMDSVGGGKICRTDAWAPVQAENNQVPLNLTFKSGTYSTKQEEPTVFNNNPYGFSGASQTENSVTINIEGGTFDGFNFGLGTLNISGGTFTGYFRTNYDKAEYTDVINISGGDFTQCSFIYCKGFGIVKDGAPFGPEYEEYGVKYVGPTVTITGGKFAFDPIDYLAAGYYAAKKGDTYTVLPVEANVIEKEKTTGAEITLNDLSKQIDLGEDATYKVVVFDAPKADVEAAKAAIATQKEIAEPTVDNPVDNNTSQMIFDVKVKKTDSYGQESIVNGITNQTVTLTLDETPAEGSKVGVYHVGANGVAQFVGMYAPNGNSVTFTAPSFSTYAVTYTPVSLAETQITDRIGVVYEKIDDNNYYVRLKALDSKKINRYMSADLTFVNNSGNIAYSITPAAYMTATKMDGERWHFEMDGTNHSFTTGEGITIGTITFTGYGNVNFKVDGSVATNIANTAKVADNIVNNYIPGGAVKELVYNDFTDTIATDELKVIATELKPETKTLTINVAYNNAISDNAAAYQDMKVTISGGDLAASLVYNLGSDFTAITDETLAFNADAYKLVVANKLTQNIAYTVTVEGAGYRTARYTVTMTADKTLNFWNNVKDTAVVIEDGKTAPTMVCNFLAGDIVKDNNINIYDLSAVVSYFGTSNTVSAASPYAKYDLNRDGKIDSKDVAYVLVSWNN